MSLIVNYDFPLTLETYIHRVGRTARMEAAGLAISFVDPSNMTVFEQLQHMDPSVTIDSPVLSARYPLKELQQPLVRTVRREELVRQDVLRLCIFAGKSKKLRPGDLVGAICSIDGVDGEDIGVIKIQEHHSYVEILNGKGTTVLSALQQRTIKNRKIRVEIAHDSE